MEKTSVYKFRSLGNDEDFNRAKAILETGHFWCSKYLELNDPMEGVYEVAIKEQYLIDEIFTDKLRFRICSFSGQEAFEKPPMWGYYTNGFKGLAFELDVGERQLVNINYVDQVQDIGELQEAREILRTKLESWEHEDEYRYLKKSKKNFHKIGKIKRLHFGDPHRDTVNRTAIRQKSKSFEDYLELREKLEAIARNMGIECHSTRIEGNRVVSGG